MIILNRLFALFRVRACMYVFSLNCDKRMFICLCIHFSRLLLDLRQTFFFTFCFQSLWLQFRSATAANAVDYSNFVLLFLANIVRSATVVFPFIVFKSIWLHFWSATATNENDFQDYSERLLKKIGSIKAFFGKDKQLSNYRLAFFQK